MKIGLLDVDGRHFPNLVLMKLSAWHKLQGDDVDWYTGIERYDRVYMSKVFSFTSDEGRVIQADEVIKGGSGYNMYDQWLPEEVEHICPDYSLYPMYKEAYGFLTRGCVNKCPFCIVPRKEGSIRKHADIEEVCSILHPHSGEDILLDRICPKCAEKYLRKDYFIKADELHSLLIKRKRNELFADYSDEKIHRLRQDMIHRRITFRGILQNANSLHEKN